MLSVTAHLEELNLQPIELSYVLVYCTYLLPVVFSILLLVIEDLDRHDTTIVQVLQVCEYFKSEATLLLNDLLHCLSA